MLSHCTLHSDVLLDHTWFESSTNVQMFCISLKTDSCAVALTEVPPTNCYQVSLLNSRQRFKIWALWKRQYTCPALCFRKSQFIQSHSISLCIKLKALTSQVGLQIQDDGSNKTHPVILSQVTPGNPNNNSAKDREQISLNQSYPSLSLQAGAWRPFWGWWDAALGKARWSWWGKFQPGLTQICLKKPNSLLTLMILSQLSTCLWPATGALQGRTGCWGVWLFPRAEIFFLQPCLLSPASIQAEKEGTPAQVGLLPHICDFSFPGSALESTTWAKGIRANVFKLRIHSETWTSQSLPGTAGQTDVPQQNSKFTYSSSIISLLQHLVKRGAVPDSALEARRMKCNYIACNETNNLDILTDTDCFSATHLGIINKGFHIHMFTLLQQSKNYHANN